MFINDYFAELRDNPITYYNKSINTLIQAFIDKPGKKYLEQFKLKATATSKFSKEKSKKFVELVKNFPGLRVLRLALDFSFLSAEHTAQILSLIPGMYRLMEFELCQSFL